MPPHNPTNCPRCRWAAEREGWRYFDDDVLKPKWLYEATLDGTPAKEWRPQGWYPPGEHHWHSRRETLPSFCTSLDAVSGLMKEMGYLYRFYWSEHGQCWRYVPSRLAPTSIDRSFSSVKDLPGACVIKAAMRTLGKEESDGNP